MVSGPSRGRQVSIPDSAYDLDKELVEFPAPLEVDRYLYEFLCELDIMKYSVSGPSRGR